MALDVSLGNVTAEEAERLAMGQGKGHVPGSTEPWVSHLIAAFARAIGARRILETGGYLGDTSMVLADMLCDLGGGELTVCELDPDRASGIRDRLSLAGYQSVNWSVVTGDALAFIRTVKDDAFDLAFLDDDHSAEHVAAETDALWNRVRPGGLLLFHDVFGVCDLRSVVKKYGGYSFDLPRLGPAGGLGCVQVTP